jgi:hypothetical protein
VRGDRQRKDERILGPLVGTDAAQQPVKGHVFSQVEVPPPAGDFMQDNRLHTLRPQRDLPLGVAE